MQLVLIIILMTSFLLLNKHSLVAKFINFLMLVSVLFSFFIVQPESGFDMDALLWGVYTGLCLTAFVFSTASFKSNKTEIQKLNKMQNFVGLFFIVIGLLCFCINLYIVLNSINQLSSGDLDVVEFKNGGGTQLKLRSIVPAPMLSFTNYVSPLAYLALVMHFYFMCSGNKKLAIITLIISLNLPLVGLQALSRAFTIIYILEYVMLFLFVQNCLQNDVKRFLLKIGTIFFFIIAFIFLLISFRRFSDEHGYYNVPSDSVIQDPVIYSLIDYFSQWVRNGLGSLRDFTLDKVWGFKSFSTIYDRFEVMLNNNVITYVELRNDTLGYYSSKFNGLVSTLVYDLTPVGVIFMLIIYFFLSKVSASGFSIRLKTLILFPYFVIIPSMFFMNNVAVYLNIQIALIYSVFFLLIGKVKLSNAQFNVRI